MGGKDPHFGVVLSSGSSAASWRARGDWEGRRRLRRRRCSSALHQVQALREDVDDLLLPNAAVVVDETVLFDGVAESDELVHYGLDGLYSKGVGVRRPEPQHLLDEVVLPLTQCEPADVELLPYLHWIELRVHLRCVMMQTCVAVSVQFA